MSNLATITNNILADSGIDDINVVVTNGSYANPAWITSLAWSKITGAPTNIITGTGAAGQVAFFNGTTTIASEINLLWDSSNNRLGIGVTPTQALDVVGKIKATDDLVLAQQNPAITFDNGTSGTLRIFSSFAAAAIATFNSTGVFTLNQYGTGARTGTRAYDLAVDASGNVIEVAVGAGTITGGGTAGQVPYFNGPSSIASDTNFTYNNVTNVFSVNGWVDSYRRFRLYFNDIQTLAAELYEDGASTNGGTLTLYSKATNTISTVISAAPTKLNFINNAANVMIGWDTDQFYKLAVNGDFYTVLDARIDGTLSIGSTSTGGYKLGIFKADEDILRIHNTTTTGDALIAFTNADAGFLARIQGFDGGGLQFDVGNGAGGLVTNALRIVNTGAATFSSSVTTGSNVIIPSGFEYVFGNGNVSILGNTSTNILDLRTNNTSRLILSSIDASFSRPITVGPIDGSFLRTFGATDTNLRWAFINSSSGVFSIQQQGDGYANQGDRLTINRSGVATFASSINSGGWFAAPNNFGLTALNAAGTAGRVLIKLNSSNQIEIGRDSDISAIRLGTASAVDAFTMLSNGNVGIAFTNPSQALQVNGRVRVSPDSSNGGDLAVNDGGLALSAIGSAPIQFFRNNYANLSLNISSLGVSTFYNTVLISSDSDIMRFGNLLRWGFQRPTTDNRYVSFVRNANATAIPVWTVDGDNGNLGLGVITQSSWNSAYKAIQFGTTGAIFGESGDAANYFTTNTFVDSVGFKYITSDWALGYFQENGVHSWRIAPSGTAGNAISFTQAMTLDSSGNLGVGTTNLPFRLNIESTSEAVARIKSTNASGAARLILNPEGAGAGSTGDASIFFDCNTSAWVAGVDKSDASKFKIANDVFGDFRAGVQLSIDNLTDRTNVVIGGTTAVNSAVNRGNLTINGSASSIMNLTVNNAIRGYMYHNGTTMDVANIADGDIEFFANNTLIAAIKAATSGQRNFVVGNAFPISTGANRANITINGNSTSILAFGTSNVQRGYLYCDGTSFYMNAGAGDFTIENNTTTALVVKQNGRVGINTTDPQAPLQVNGNFRLYTTNNDGNELRGIFNVGGAADPLSFSMYKGDAATIGILLSADGTTYFNGTNVLVGTTSDIGTAFRVVGGATGIDFETNVSSTYARSIFFTTRETGVAREIGLTGGYSYGPSNPLTMVLTQTSDTPIAMFRASDDAVGAGLKGYKGRGTVATPASVANGDTIFSMEGWAFHGSGPNHAKFGAGMRFVKDDAFGTANTFAPQRTEFYNANSTTTTITTFTILPNANCTAGGSMTATSFFESSDSRIKTLLDNNVDYSLIANVGAKYYKKGDIEELGYFAQDFEQILPSAVYKDEKGLLNLSYTQVHTAKIAALEARVKELEQQLKNK